MPLVELEVATKGIEALTALLTTVATAERVGRAHSIYKELRRRDVSRTTAIKAAIKAFVSSETYREMDACIDMVDDSPFPREYKRYLYKACVAEPKLTRKLINPW